MRQIFLYVFLLICSGVGAQGQLRLGVSSGVHWAFRQWYLHELNLDLDYRPAPASRFTVVLDWPTGNVLGMHAESGFQDYRNLIEVVIEDGYPSTLLQGYFSERLRAWTSSVLLTVRPFRFKWLYLEGGLASAYLIESLSKPVGNLRTSLSDPDIYTVRSTDMSAYQRFQMLADVGVGLSLPISQRMHLLTEVRYQYGLREMEDVRTVTSRLGALGVNAGLLYALNSAP